LARLGRPILDQFGNDGIGRSERDASSTCHISGSEQILGQGRRHLPGDELGLTVLRIRFYRRRELQRWWE
jgi:hypothetical protein